MNLRVRENYGRLPELAWNLSWKSPGFQITIPTLHLRHWDFFFVLSFVGLYSIHRLSYVKEEGEIDEPIFIDSLIAYGKDKRNFSTAGGIRNIMRFPVNGMDIQSDNNALRYRPDMKQQQDRGDSEQEKSG